LSVKGGINLDGGRLNAPDASIEALRKSVDNINQKLGGKKKMDLFQVCIYTTLMVFSRPYFLS
jgi:pyridoxine 4-dehydrogenase